MKLISLKILSEFRNLNGLELKFNTQTNTYVLIGNNGAGKSSLLEAVSSIFYSLYQGGELRFEFNFTLAYNFEGHKVSIANKPGKTIKMTVDKVEIDRAHLEPYLPQRVICNYSGEETRINEWYYKPLWKQYEDRLKVAAGFNPLKMIFVEKDLWKIILYVIIAQRGRYESFDIFLKNTLKVTSVDRIEIELDEDTLRGTWRDNPVTFYMRRLADRIQPNGTLALGDMNPDDDEALTMFTNLSSARSLFKQLKIIFNGTIDSQYLSEGEKKLMVVLFILEVISDERSLVLLDEPDSHLHVARKPEMVELFKSVPNRENVLTSHSPTLTSEFDLKSIIMLDRKNDGHAQVVEADKQKIVSELTKDKWSLQRQNIFLASNDDIILVEGWTDEVFLSKALEALKANGQFTAHKYEYLPCNGASGIALLKDRFAPKAGQQMFCFFDNDSAGWQTINKIFGTTEATILNPANYGRARKQGHIWLAPYPCARGKASNFNIEDYFPRRIFLHHVLSFRNLNEVMDKDGLKKKMAEECKVSGKMKQVDYKHFAVVFQLIEDIKVADAAGRDVLV